MKQPCDICGYIHEKSNSRVVQLCSDGLYRCRLCRQRAEYGRTFFNDKDEYKAEKAGERKEIEEIDVG